MQKNVFYSLKEDDEFYTPRYVVEPYIPKLSKKFHFLGKRKYETDIAPVFLVKIEVPSVLYSNANAMLMSDEE